MQRRDHSRLIMAWRLGATMSARDISDTLDDVLGFTGQDKIHVDTVEEQMRQSRRWQDD